MKNKKKTKKKRFSLSDLKIVSIKSTISDSGALGFLNTSQFGTLCTGGDKCCQ